MGTSGQRILGVGIIGCGELTQVGHIPTFGFLSDIFKIVYLCDVSEAALQHCKKKVIGGLPRTTRDPRVLCEAPEVDVVVVATSDEYHAVHAIEGLKSDKFVFVEKPMALCMRDADRIVQAESTSRGKVMVGYMRRYAPAFLDAVEEIGGIDKILYGRVRDIIGPNAGFVNQSGTFPKTFTDFRPEDAKDKVSRGAEIVNQALAEECGVPVTDASTLMWRVLGGLGSHDLSVMREALGIPTAVLGASLSFPFWNALFQYPGFPVMYESGLDGIPRFDAHIEIYGQNKSVKVQYDSPYVKGLPTIMVVKENVDGVYKESTVRKTYEDNYTQEMKELYQIFTEGKAIKTTPTDAKKDLEIFRMIMQAGAKNQL
ncbi:myo-inositol 2-dehydrogenase [Phlyctema vagabunda]|uniref:Myo-inositol 2-dehydrogenase n=1 Tax=Phlyctema vagabunda TaxID=108571 RepID=A0ABR4P5Y8_9HELO